MDILSRVTVLFFVFNIFIIFSYVYVCMVGGWILHGCVQTRLLKFQEVIHYLIWDLELSII